VVRVTLRGALAGAVLVALVGGARAGDVLLYRGAFVYLVPPLVVRRMAELTPPGDWRQFPELTRRVDADNDGSDDFVAIALGSSNGHGMQLRYRLRAHGSRIGRWYWCVITDPAGRQVFERFNP